MTKYVWVDGQVRYFSHRSFIVLGLILSPLRHVFGIHLEHRPKYPVRSMDSGMDVCTCIQYDAISLGMNMDEDVDVDVDVNALYSVHSKLDIFIH